MFGESTAGKLLEKWPTTFRQKVIRQCGKLPSTNELEDLLLAANPHEEDDDPGETGKIFKIVVL